MSTVVPLPSSQSPIVLITVPRVDSKNNLADALTKIIDNSVYFNFGASMLRSWTMAC